MATPRPVPDSRRPRAVRPSLTLPKPPASSRLVHGTALPARERDRVVLSLLLLPDKREIGTR
jgi:hypothetical protein